ncbi:MAG TPA: hypothetical protein VEP68_00360, partial [Anaeromyxobacteraceae bacterium]|nr:hypothetical protein [Anaeromyxobacteraceae bacterium]
HPEVVIVYADGYILDESTGTRQELRLPFGSLERGTTVFASRDRVFPQDFTLCNVLFKRSLAVELDAFDNPLNLCADSELFLKACLFGDVGVIHELVSQYRIHGSNLIFRHHEDLRIYAANLDYFFRPRRLAIERGALTRPQRRAFEAAARRGLRKTVVVVSERHGERVAEVVDRLWEADPWLTLRALCHRRTAGLALGRLGRWLRRALPRGVGRVD